MQKFIIGNDNFGVGEINYEADKENGIINDLTIIGDQSTFRTLSDSKNDSWSWTLYPPEFYLRKIDYNLNQAGIHAIISENTPLDLSRRGFHGKH
jgi:hypothetical protein